MPDITDISSVAKVIPSDNPWMQPPLRKLSNEIHDNATQMMILGKLIVSLGDLMERLITTVNEHDKSIRESIGAIRELTQTLKDTLE